MVSMCSSSMLGSTWEYRSKVTPTVEWSEASETIFCGFFFNARMAQACRYPRDVRWGKCVL